MIEKAFPASQLWNSSPKNHPTRYNIYAGGLIYQKTSATSNSTSYCTPSLGGRGSLLTICQLNQFNTNSEAAMLSIESLRIHGWLNVHYVCETTHLNMKKIELLVCIYDAVSDLMHNWVAQRPDFKSALRVVRMVLNTQCYQYLWLAMWFHAKKIKRNT